MEGPRSREDQEHNVELKLPNPDGDLCKTVLSKAICAANESIKQLVQPRLKEVRKATYQVLTPQQFAVRKRAAEHGVMATR